MFSNFINFSFLNFFMNVFLGLIFFLSFSYFIVIDFLSNKFIGGILLLLFNFLSLEFLNLVGNMFNMVVFFEIGNLVVFGYLDFLNNNM